MRNPRTLDAQHIRLSSCLVYSRGGSYYRKSVNVNLSCCQSEFASFLAAFYRVGPDGRHGSAPPADVSGSMGRAVSEAALYTQLSALHRCLVRGVTCGLTRASFESCRRRKAAALQAYRPTQKGVNQRKMDVENASVHL
jgi:hypothetical protein